MAAPVSYLFDSNRVTYCLLKFQKHKNETPFRELLEFEDPKVA